MFERVREANRKHVITLAIVAAYLVTDALLLATDFLDFMGYIKASMFMIALLICIILPIKNWQIPMKSKLSPLASFLFAFGALITVRMVIGHYQSWTNSWLSELSPEAQQSILDSTKETIPNSIKTPLELVLTMLIGPIGEEFIYRFCLLGSLAVFIRKEWALIISTVLFVLGHYWGHNVIALGEVAILGTAASLTYLMCGLGWAIFLHALFNSFWTLQHSQLMYLLHTVLMPFSLWVFFTRLFRLRKVVFGADSQGVSA